MSIGINPRSLIRRALIPILLAATGCDGRPMVAAETSPFPDVLVRIRLGATSEGVTQVLGAAADSSHTQCFSGFIKHYARAEGDVHVVLSTDSGPHFGVASIRLASSQDQVSRGEISIGSNRSEVLAAAGAPTEHSEWEHRRFDRYETDAGAVELDYQNDIVRAIEIQTKGYRHFRDECLPQPLRVGLTWNYEVVEAEAPLDEFEKSRLVTTFTSSIVSREQVNQSLYYRIVGHTGFSMANELESFDTLLVRSENERLYGMLFGEEKLLFDFSADSTFYTRIKNRPGTTFYLYAEPNDPEMPIGSECVSWNGRSGWVWEECFERGRGRTRITLRDSGLNTISSARWITIGND